MSRSQPDPYIEAKLVARECSCLDLSTGLPDLELPGAAMIALQQRAEVLSNIYSEPAGLFCLRDAIARSAPADDRPDPVDEITVTNGATEGLFATLSLLGPGAKVAALSPCYDYYRAMCEALHLIFVPVSLSSDGDRFSIDVDQLDRQTERGVQAIILNSPHNPTGIVLSDEQVLAIAAIARRRDAVLIFDLVYEYFGGRGTRIGEACRRWPDLRTVRVSSASKTLGVAGWRVGWTIASPQLSRSIREAHRNIAACAPTLLQAAVAEALEAGAEREAERRYEEQFRITKAMIADHLECCGYRVSSPAGGVFLMARHREGPGARSVRRVASETGLTPLSMRSYFAHDPEQGESWIRFNFAKDPEVVRRAISPGRPHNGGQGGLHGFGQAAPVSR